MASIFLNGEFIERDDAHLSVFDAGIQHGVGLFETMLARHGTEEPIIERLDAHVGRLVDSARQLGLSNDLRSGPLAEAVVETVRRSGLEHARVRLTVTGGDLNLLETAGRSNVRPTILISAQPATRYPDEMFDRGVMAALADARVNPLDPFAGHKTLNYWMRLRELQAAATKGAGEAIVFQVSNHLAGGCVSNIFLVADSTLHTPIARGEEEPGAIPSPVLPGVTRDTVIEKAEAIGIGCARRMLTIDDLLGADEVFLTNSSWGILPVVRVEAELIGDATVGEVTRTLRDRLAAG